MVLVHDDDLITIDELNYDDVSEYMIGVKLPFLYQQSPETLEPDAMMDLLRKSNIGVHKISYGEIPILTQT